MSSLLLYRVHYIEFATIKHSECFVDNDGRDTVNYNNPILSYKQSLLEQGDEINNNEEVFGNFDIDPLMMNNKDKTSYENQ